ncbi:MAG TPA: hypothetical protein PKA95_04625 [Thermomicrobiales bacterium]|nr:hypothetical protein [Thermomicrobiales bacterium]
MPDFEDFGCVVIGLVGLLVVIALVACVALVLLLAGGSALFNL